MNQPSSTTAPAIYSAEQIRDALVQACGEGGNELTQMGLAALLRERHPWWSVAANVAVLRDRAKTYEAFADELRSMAELTATQPV